MKVLEVMPYINPRFGGPPRIFVEQVRELARLGHQVVFAAADEDGERVEQGSAGEVFQIFGLDKWRNWRMSDGLAEYLRDHIREFDVVHIHTFYKYPAFIAAYYARKYKAPHIVTLHDAISPLRWKRNRLKKWVYMTLFGWRTLSHATLIHYTNDSEVERTRTVMKIPRPGIVVPYGMDLQPFQNMPTKAEARQRLHVEPDEQLILFMSRLNYVKGLDLLTEAFSNLKHLYPKSRLIVAGPDNDNYMPTLMGYIDTFKIRERTILPGMITGTVKLDWLAAADLFVLPSYSENFGMVLAEAMASGLPVITTENVAIAEELKQCEAAVVIPCDAGRLSSAISDLLGNREAADQLARRGHEYVLRYDWPNVIHQYVKMYELALQREQSTDKL